MLSERRQRVLRALIEDYIEYALPVGSRTLTERHRLGVSPATVRNDLSALEDAGFIQQPHTSAGRIPSDKGYRFYVDQIMQEKEQEVTEVKSLMIKRVDRVELVLKKLAQLLANNTNYAAMISGPQYHQNKLKFIQLSQMEENKLLVVIVVEGNLIKNAMVDIPEPVSQEEILNLNILLNSALNGLTIEQINLDVITKLKQQAGAHSQIIDLVLNEVAGAIRADEEDLQIYTSGATNIFKYP